MLGVLCAGPVSQGCCYRRFTQISVRWTDVRRAAFLCTVGHRYSSHRRQAVPLPELSACSLSCPLVPEMRLEEVAASLLLS